VTLLLALLLDAALGEPRALWDRVPHPAVLMGRAVDWLDRTLNRGSHRQARGIAAVAVLVLGAVALGQVLSWIPFAEVVAGAILLAQRSLADHVAEVAHALRRSLPEGRRAVAMIVGRDTATMNEPAVARAAIESAAENFSDGVLAPALFLAVLGLPGLLIYKVVNTADSMIGHRTPRHEQFGWAAARLDDLLNLIPARLSAGLLWLAGGGRGPWDRIAHDARRHRSPNAGWPEAAAARALGVALSGPRSYGGAMQDFPYVHRSGRREIGARDVDRAVRLLWRAWAIVVAIALLAALL
jgi:adenosylcobinamide-phosphate synthase